MPTRFARMKPGSLFRQHRAWPLCDYDALYEALTEGPLAGAMLETFAIEPVPPDWPLLQLPNVTLTPHIAGASIRTVTHAAEQAAEEVRRYLAGETLPQPLLSRRSVRIRERADMTDTVDLFVIGGGINGAGIARDAAGRGPQRDPV